MGKRGRAPDAGEGSGNKKSKWFSSNNKASLPHGCRGVLVSCVGGKEFQASRDAIRILTECYDNLKAASSAAAPATEGTARAPEEAASKPKDISSAIADEVADLKKSDNQLFTFHKVNVYGLMFISLNAKEEHPTPQELVQTAAKDVLDTKECKSKLCMRFLPVEGICYASLADIKTLWGKIMPKHFPADKDATPITWSILYEHRASGKLLQRTEVIDTIGNMVPKPPHKVDLGKPQKTILAQVVKSAIAIGVVDDYNGLGKLNLRELSSIVDEDEEAATEHKGTVDGNASKAANSEADVGAPDQDPKQGVNDESAAPAAASADGT